LEALFVNEYKNVTNGYGEDLLAKMKIDYVIHNGTSYDTFEDVEDIRDQVLDSLWQYFLATDEKSVLTCINQDEDEVVAFYGKVK
jgi:hypothetical protein